MPLKKKIMYFAFGCLIGCLPMWIVILGITGIWFKNGFRWYYLFPVPVILIIGVGIMKNNILRYESPEEWERKDDEYYKNKYGLPKEKYFKT